MPNDETLSIYTLGPVQVFRGDERLTGWAYLDSAELLFYLLRHTRRPQRPPGAAPLTTDDLHGRTKEQIGLELWPEASPQQLASKLKSRLHDLRRGLGDGNWILFENGQYKFNATRAYWFDAEQFAEHLAAAERLSAADPPRAITHFQAAVQLYRGDFLAELRPRRAHKGPRPDDGPEGAGREWQYAAQDELLNAYQTALGRLAKLLLAERGFEAAAETYRLALAKDDYDDDAHYGLIYCLACQGRRSQALEHYRRLLKRRADLPPTPEITALAERLKRGDELAPQAARPAPPPVQPAALAPFQVPADLPRFVGREQEAGQLAAALTRDDGPRRVWLGGMGGLGKTSLAIHLAHTLRAAFPDGVLWAHVSTSEPLAILDSWARAFGCDFSGLPDLDSRAAALRAVLADKRVLLILDDVWDAARARALLVGGEPARVVLTGRNLEVAEALDAQIVALPVFAAAESQALLARPDLRERLAAEPAEAEAIGALLGHLPLALDIAAHRLASRPHWSLRELAERLRVQQQRLAELKIGDLAVRASFAVSWEALDEPLRGTFAALGAFAGRALAPAALAAVTAPDKVTAPDRPTRPGTPAVLGQITRPGGPAAPDRPMTLGKIIAPGKPMALGEPTAPDEAAARERLDALVGLSLLSIADEVHYRQHPLLADFAREHLAEPAAADGRMAQHFLHYATAQRQHYLALEQEWDNLAAGLAVAHQQQRWQMVIDYGDVLTNAWFALGRFGYARQALPLICEAARREEEQDPYIAATINWGRACIEQGDYEEARQHLEHALQTSREVNDEHGQARAQFELGHVAHEQSQQDEARRLLTVSQALFEKLDDPVGVGAALILQARIQYRHYDYAGVEQLAQRALAALTDVEKPQQAVEALRYLALAAAHQNQPAAADQYCQEALQLCEDHQYRAELPSVLYTWMQVCLVRDDFEPAQQHGQRSAALFSISGDRKSQAFVLAGLIRVYMALGDFDQAEASGQQSLELFKAMQDDWHLVYAWRDLGRVFARQGRREDARQVWRAALDQAQTLHHPLVDEVQGLLNSADLTPPAPLPLKGRGEKNS